mmetsp:Transcript_1346/g.2559  ORF Transcript_1346/g.2559 Transcript_1346/m.2559 type:complete len:265 (-) Transcript_1346:110-904(-)
MVCGHVGCGRYHKLHAVQHFEQTGHRYSIDLQSLLIWDYESDGYKHRIDREDRDLDESGRSHGRHGGGKTEKCGNSSEEEVLDTQEMLDIDSMKIQSVSSYYETLLQSQLEQQYQYFQEKLNDIHKTSSVKLQTQAEATKELTDQKAKLQQQIDDVDRQIKQVDKKLLNSQTRLTKVLTQNQFLQDLNFSILSDQNKHKQQLKSNNISGTEHSEQNSVSATASNSNSKDDARFERLKLEKQKRVQQLTDQVSALMAKLEEKSDT